MGELEREKAAGDSETGSGLWSIIATGDGHEGSTPQLVRGVRCPKGSRGSCSTCSWPSKETPFTRWSGSGIAWQSKTELSKCQGSNSGSLPMPRAAGNPQGGATCGCVFALCVLLGETQPRGTWIFPLGQCHPCGRWKKGQHLVATCLYPNNLP